MTANDAIKVLKQVKSREELFSDELNKAIDVAISALKYIGKDPSKDIIIYKSYLQKAVDDFRSIGEHRAKLCNFTYSSCDNCPLDVNDGEKQCCDKWVLEDEVMELMNR